MPNNQPESSFSSLCSQLYTLLSGQQANTASEQRPVLVALDGRCGSGKTTLAAQLAERFPASVTLHTDDYYLPPERRVPGWERIPCANMDLERLRTEALVPLHEGYTGRSCAYCCGAGAYRAAGPLEPQPLVIVEGSYSCHPSLAELYDVRVFVTCAPEEQARRLAAREGSHFADFAARWIPLEEAYFAQFGIKAKADFVLDTSAAH